MAAYTQVAGNPVHRIVSYRTATTTRGLPITFWRAACGPEFADIHLTVRYAASVSESELCLSGCWPQGVRVVYPKSIDESENDHACL